MYLSFPFQFVGTLPRHGYPGPHTISHPAIRTQSTARMDLQVGLSLETTGRIATSTAGSEHVTPVLLLSTISKNLGGSDYRGLEIGMIGRVG